MKAFVESTPYLSLGMHSFVTQINLYNRKICEVIKLYGLHYFQTICLDPIHQLIHKTLYHVKVLSFQSSTKVNS